VGVEAPLAFAEILTGMRRADPYAK